MSAMNATLSLFIPRVFPNISSDRIAGVFEKQEFGKVKRVDLVNQGGYNRAYVHFDEWCDSPMVRSFQERVLNKKDRVVVVYDDPYYWIVLENTSTYSPGDELGPKKKINIDGDVNKKTKPLSGPAPTIVDMQVQANYIHWLQSENIRLQQTVNYLLQQAEMDVEWEAANRVVAEEDDLPKDIISLTRDEMDELEGQFNRMLNAEQDKEEMEELEKQAVMHAIS
jgi:hypothetical protein